MRPLFLPLAVALVVLVWTLTPATWFHGCGGPGYVQAKSPAEVNHKLEQMLGPPGTLVTEDLLVGTIRLLHGDDDVSSGYVRITVDGVVRVFQRVVEDTHHVPIWRRTE